MLLKKFVMEWEWEKRVHGLTTFPANCGFTTFKEELSSVDITQFAIWGFPIVNTTIITVIALVILPMAHNFFYATGDHHQSLSNSTSRPDTNFSTLAQNVSSTFV
ncbi:hypothetical protein Fcan01_09030 [Folsomia candida]|uniref:Uncharacterized protein n=2 Tax=Folsomia candida TaxID=158441 RepID=A0A226EGI0_FOLCA|nr:hypothetical protein Fcan01_09030 [Folsomia candida]